MLELCAIYHNSPACVCKQRDCRWRKHRLSPTFCGCSVAGCQCFGAVRACRVLHLFSSVVFSYLFLLVFSHSHWWSSYIYSQLRHVEEYGKDAVSEDEQSVLSNVKGARSWVIFIVVVKCTSTPTSVCVSVGGTVLCLEDVLRSLCVIRMRK